MYPFNNQWTFFLYVAKVCFFKSKDKFDSMLQVPTYGVIGSGKMAKHFIRYLTLLNLPTLIWSRRSGRDLDDVLEKTSHLLVLISDDAIDSFIRTQLKLYPGVIIHFSGCLQSKLAFSAHPFMSFSSTLYELDFYQKIPFHLEKSGPVFEALLPGLSNPHQYIDRALKPYYHALCVIMNNFTTILWKEALAGFEGKLGLARESVMLYVEQTAKSMINSPNLPLTGPLVRGDHASIVKNLSALEGDCLQQVYQVFSDCFTQSKE